MTCSASRRLVFSISRESTSGPSERAFRIFEKTERRFRRYRPGRLGRSSAELSCRTFRTSPFLGHQSLEQQRFLRTQPLELL